MSQSEEEEGGQCVNGMCMPWRLAAVQMRSVSWRYDAIRVESSTSVGSSAFFFSLLKGVLHFSSAMTARSEFT